MTFSKAILCRYTGKRILSGFIQTMQIVEKHHNLTLRALILSKKIVVCHPLNPPNLTDLEYEWHAKLTMTSRDGFINI